MKRIGLILALLFLTGVAFASSDTTFVGGLITTNAVWDSTGSPYVVTANVGVLGATLTIGPGVNVLFNQDLNLQILDGGELIAEGTFMDSIVFTSLEDSSSWSGIVFKENSIPSIVESDSIYIGGSLMNFTIVENVSKEDTVNGSALFSEVSLLIKNTRFSNNSGNLGSAIYYSNWQEVGDGNFLNIIRCNFFSNMASQHYDGGTIYHNSQAGTMLINNSIFKDNSNIGVITYQSSTTLYINSSVFIGNHGGGVQNAWTTTIYNSIFKDNTAHTGWDGGGVRITSSGRLTVLNSLFENNRAENGGAISANRLENISDNVFNKNEAELLGGAIYSDGFHSQDGLINQNTFIENKSQEGAAIYYLFWNATIGSNIFSNNHAVSISILHMKHGNGTFQNNLLIDTNEEVFDGYLLFGNFLGSGNSFYSKNFNTILHMGAGSDTYNFEKNFFSTKDSTTIEDSLVFDLLDDPTFNTSRADWFPFLFAPSDSVPGLPTNITSINIKEDSTYQQSITDSIYQGSTLYIQIEANDENVYSPDLTAAYIINNTSNDTILPTLIENGDSTGIFRGIASVGNDTYFIHDILGTAIGDSLTVISRTDPSKTFGVIVVARPAPIASLLDVGGENDIFHVLLDTPIINWKYDHLLGDSQTSYHVQVGSDNDWSIVEFWDSEEITSADTSVTYAGSALNDYSTYFVRARVFNGIRWSGWIDTSFALNSIPVISITDTSFLEDSTLSFSLNPYISDTDDHDTLLTITWDNNVNVGVAVNLSTHEVTFSPQSNWFGTEAIKFIVTDPWGFSDVDTVSVSVQPINDGPIVSDIPDTLFFEDENLMLNLNLYVYDSDDSLSSLVWNVMSPDGGMISSTTRNGSKVKTFFIPYSIEQILESDVDAKQTPELYSKSNENLGFIGSSSDITIGDTVTVMIDALTHIATFTSTLNYNIENVPFIFTVTDTSGLSDSDTMRVTVFPVNDPPVLSNLPDVIFNEDESAIVHFSGWFGFVDDVDDVDSTLKWSLTSGIGDSVSFIIQGDSVIFEAPQDWFAFDRDTILVEVTDGFLTDSIKLAVHVMPVNDPPMFINFPDTVTLNYGQNDTLILSDFVLDIDDPDSLLLWSQFACVGADSIVCVTTNADTAFIDPVGNFSGTAQFEFWVTDTSGASDTVSIIIYVMKPVGINDELTGIPDKFSLSNAYPNPFNPQTTISYGLPQESDVTLIIYNLMGQEIMRWDEQSVQPGYYSKVWNGTNKFGVPVGSGVYLYRLVAGDFVETRKMVLLK